MVEAFASPTSHEKEYLLTAAAKGGNFLIFEKVAELLDGEVRTDLGSSPPHKTADCRIAMMLYSDPKR